MKKNLPPFRALTGAEAVAEAMRQINPEVVPVYPITPQTPIAQKFAQMVADGMVDSEMIRVESEHSALSAAVGAAASGVRTMTATSSAGLALMWEILGCASGLRLPIVMSVVNRTLSAPLNIHCDHSDSMGARETGWIQLFCENAQQAYEHTLLAVRLAEHSDILLPVMVMQDGFITSHSVQNVVIFPDLEVKKFLGTYTAQYSLLDVKNPVTFGPLQLPDYSFETKRQLLAAFENVPEVFLKIGKELTRVTGNAYPFFEAYKLADADYAIVVLSSTAGTTKVVIDDLRAKGHKVGLLKPNLYRPFPSREIAEALAHLKAVAVLDRSTAPGQWPPLFLDIKNALYDLPKRPVLQSYIFGLGGRDILEEHLVSVFQNLAKVTKDTDHQLYLGLRE